MFWVPEIWGRHLPDSAGGVVTSGKPKKGSAVVLEHGLFMGLETSVVPSLNIIKSLNQS